MLLAVVAGVLLTCSFPNINVAGFGWLAPGLMLAAALGTARGECLRIGFVAGLSHFLTLLYWLLLIPYRWHGLPLGPALGWLALSAFAALFPAVWVWLTVLFSRARTAPPRPSVRELPQGTSVPGTGSFLNVLATDLPSTWLSRGVWMLASAAAWVGLEMVRARIFGGFPWNPLGSSQYRMVPLIQIASITGVYGVSFMMIWVSLSLLTAGLMIVRRPGVRQVWVAEVCVPVLVAAALFNIGFRELRAAASLKPERTLRVMLIQPSIPQTLIWDPGKDTNRFNELVAYTSETLSSNKSDLVIWPESAVPKMVRYDTNTFNAITNLARTKDVWVIVGSDDAEPSRRAGNPDAADYFNSSFLISPKGELVARYIKRNLVIFGEYVPLQHWLPFLQWFTPVEGSFTPGTGPEEFNLKELGVRTSVLICFEDIFPHLGREDVKPETDFLVNITNDGWFGESAEQWQQATAALFRTIENRVPLVRCCNNGVSCWIDAQGRIRDVLRDAQGTVYGKGSLQIQIPILPAGESRSATFYTRHGDVFGWSCTGVSLMFLIAGSLHHRPARPTA